MTRFSGNDPVRLAERDDARSAVQANIFSTK
jgi:hypothetical protein